VPYLRLLGWRHPARWDDFTLDMLIPRGGHPRELHINRKTGEFTADRDVVRKAERSG